MITIAVTNQKGGVGKTTTTLTLGAALAKLGQNVRAIGLDEQRDLCSFADVMSEYSKSLSFADATAKTLAREIKLAQKERCDFALLDCPPALGDEVAAAIKVADRVIVPIQTESLAVRGLASILEVIQAARQSSTRSIPVDILITMFDQGDSDACDMESELREMFAGNATTRVFSRVVKRNRAFPQASMQEQTVLQFAPRSHGANTYRALAREIVRETK